MKRRPASATIIAVLLETLMAILHYSTHIESRYDSR